MPILGLLTTRKVFIRWERIIGLESMAEKTALMERTGLHRMFKAILRLKRASMTVLPNAVARLSSGPNLDNSLTVP
eukprot:5245940-Pleurochrysis_carterae.AAC.1